MRLRLSPALVVGALLATAAHAWNIVCVDATGEKCADGYAKARAEWGPAPQSEHRRLMERTLEVSGLPASLREPFELTVHADDAPLVGEEGRTYQTIRPVRQGARRIATRRLTVQAMANLPDNSYTLWDWASGNELCPPDRGNPDAVDCHNYETHIGWLNANHMLPQSQRFYEHLHRLALDRAAECKAFHDAIPSDQRPRFEPILRACEKQALVIEAVGHHYLQDSWSIGHMWERWGGVEIGDFRGSRPLGFAIAAFTGTIHGAGAMIPLGAADDPLCAPHADSNYVDDPDAFPREHPGVGDVYLEDFLFQPAGPWAAQRLALLGCAVDGVRAVYGASAQVHGPMQAPDAAQIDASRRVGDLTCWRQRVTNEAIATGCGIHFGVFPNQIEVLSGALGGAAVAGILPLAQTSALAEVLGAPELLPIDDAARFARDAAYTCTLAAAHAAIPGIAQQTNLAAGGLPALVGIQPNSFYARGNAFSTPLVPPASYADPALPWSLDAADARAEKEALNLTFVDAHAPDRCRTFTEANLLTYRDEIDLARTVGDATVVEARCSQCAQLVAPHVRVGTGPEDFDPTREALCAFVDAAVPLVYLAPERAGSDDDPRALATKWCGCEGACVLEGEATLRASSFGFDDDDRNEASRGSVSAAHAGSLDSGAATVRFGFASAQARHDVDGQPHGGAAASGDWEDALVINPSDPALLGQVGTMRARIVFTATGTATSIQGPPARVFHRVRVRVGFRGANRRDFDLQRFDDGSTSGPPPGTYDIGPFEFVFGQPFDMEVETSVAATWTGLVDVPHFGSAEGTTTSRWLGITEIRGAGDQAVPFTLCSASGTNWETAQ